MSGVASLAEVWHGQRGRGHGRQVALARVRDKFAVSERAASNLLPGPCFLLWWTVEFQKILTPIRLIMQRIQLLLRGKGGGRGGGLRWWVGVEAGGAFSGAFLQRSRKRPWNHVHDPVSTRRLLLFT